LRNIPRLQIDNLNALLAPAAEHNYRFVLSRGEHEIDRQTTEVNCVAGGIEVHTCGQGRSEDRFRLRERRRAQERTEGENQPTDAK